MNKPKSNLTQEEKDKIKTLEFKFSKTERFIRKRGKNAEK